MAETSKITGLGDIVAIVAEPIAAAIDKATGTKIRGCQSCARRRMRLNRRFPVISKLKD